MHTMNALMADDPLVRLVQKDSFVGWVFDLDYDTMKVMTNDVWKRQAAGVPHNCFLLACTFDPENFSKVPDEERELFLLRVICATKLPSTDDLVRAKISHLQNQKDLYETKDRAYDKLTQAQMQWSGIECRILGTFYKRDGHLVLGADLESYVSAARLQVYRPRGEALKAVVNHVDGIKVEQARRFNRERLGIDRDIPSIPLGTVKYTATDRLHRASDGDCVPFHVQPANFLARRTAVFGMTRTGKSNFVKQVVSSVMGVAAQGGIKVGQLIFDLNGEYANANQQDQGAIATVFHEDTIRYRMIPKPGFKDLRDNFHASSTLASGHAIIRRIIQEKYPNPSGDLQVFINTDLNPPENAGGGAQNRYQVRCAAYRVLLYHAGFEPPPASKIKFPTSAQVREAVRAADASCTKDPKDGLTYDEALAWFRACRKANLTSQLMSSSSRKPKKAQSGAASATSEATTESEIDLDAAETGSGDQGGQEGPKPWLDNDTASILNLIEGKNRTNTDIMGWRTLTPARVFHSPTRSSEVVHEIYEQLTQGKIVIVDLSVGDEGLVEALAKRIAEHIRARSMQINNEDKNPSPILIYIEEAHNLIGKDANLKDTWPRIAKEGAKSLIGLVYATQEVSTIHPNILANTENWFITHLNNEREIKTLSAFYDFADFGRSLLRSDEVGFARSKTLTSPFVVPIKIDKFEPEAARKRFEDLRNRAKSSKATPTQPWVRRDQQEEPRPNSGHGTMPDGRAVD